MREQATTLDLVDLTRLAFEAANRRDLDAVITFWACDAVFEGRMARETFEGRVAIRSLLEDWFGAYDELELKLEDVRDLGSGVVFAVVVQEGVPAGSVGHGHVWQREGWIFLWERGLIARLATLYNDIDEGRAAAERLARERQAVSRRNVEVVRRLVAALNARDVESYLACCSKDVELRTPAVGGVYEGRKGIERWFADIEDAGPDFHIDLRGVKAIGRNQVLARFYAASTGRASGVPVSMETAQTYDLIDGKISRIRIFLDHGEALQAVGLEG